MQIPDKPSNPKSNISKPTPSRSKSYPADQTKTPTRTHPLKSANPWPTRRRRPPDEHPLINPPKNIDKHTHTHTQKNTKKRTNKHPRNPDEPTARAQPAPHGGNARAHAHHDPTATPQCLPPEAHRPKPGTVSQRPSLTNQPTQLFPHTQKNYHHPHAQSQTDHHAHQAHQHGANDQRHDAHHPLHHGQSDTTNSAIPQAEPIANLA